MLQKFFANKIWVFLSAAIAILALVLLAVGLGDIHFQPGHPLARGETTILQVSVEKIVAGMADIPIWKQVVFWVMVLLLVIVGASLFTPEMRKRLIRYFLRLALFILALFYIVKNYRWLFPRLNLGVVHPPQNGAIIGGQNSQAVFIPPHIPSTLLYIISLGVILVLALIAFLAGRWWVRRQRLITVSPSLEGLADIARSSLSELSSGGPWEDAIINCYVRMSMVVASRRSLQRREDLTASEFAIRLEKAGLPGESVRRLTCLFEEARYGARQASRMEISEAVACLNSILYACGVDK